LRRIKEWMYLNLVRRLECANPDHALTICDEGEERSEERSEARSETKRGVKRSEEWEAVSCVDMWYAAVAPLQPYVLHSSPDLT